MWRPASPFPSQPFCCARPARSTSSVIGFKQQNGLALEFVSQEMKGDRELCMAAVAQDGSAIQFVSQKMKGDAEVVLAAWKNVR